MVYGDTGWREITTTVPAGITATNLRIRRLGNIVFVNVQAVSSTAARNVTFVTLPDGFAADSTVLRAGLAADRSGTSIRQLSPFGGGIRVLDMEATKAYEIGSSFTTKDRGPPPCPGQQWECWRRRRPRRRDRAAGSVVARAGRRDPLRIRDADIRCRGLRGPPHPDQRPRRIRLLRTLRGPRLRGPTRQTRHYAYDPEK
jgi:hypothetical protein